MGGVLLRACAKVNYALEVRGLRGDGYHEISSVLQSVSLADELEIERSRGGFELSFEPEGVEIGPVEENTVYKAWASLWEASGHELPTRIRLHKKIPAGAGLGGGSADAAAVLVGMNELFDLGLDAEQLRTIGARIGADVPFCLSGGTALAQGVGEILTPRAGRGYGWDLPRLQRARLRRNRLRRSGRRGAPFGQPHRARRGPRQ
jgi:4-diphosphocytidyl-2-C-methyl-D-erythritol kinase